MRILFALAALTGMMGSTTTTESTTITTAKLTPSTPDSIASIWTSSVDEAPTTFSGTVAPTKPALRTVVVSGVAVSCLTCASTVKPVPKVTKTEVALSVFQSVYSWFQDNKRLKAEKQKACQTTCILGCTIC